MTTQIKKQKVSKDDKLETITFCLKNRGIGIRPNPKCNIKMLDLIIDKYSIDFEKEFVLMKEERKIFLEEEKERKNKEEKEIELRNKKWEIEKKRKEDDYKNLPWRIKNMCEKAYMDVEYSNHIKFYQRELNSNRKLVEYSLMQGGNSHSSYMMENGTAYILGIYYNPISCEGFNPVSVYKTTLYKFKYIRELIEELKLDEWYNAKVVIIHRKKKIL
jgi:hypothetical protein